MEEYGCGNINLDGLGAITTFRIQEECRRLRNGSWLRFNFQTFELGFEDTAGRLKQTQHLTLFCVKNVKIFLI